MENINFSQRKHIFFILLDYNNLQMNYKDTYGAER